MGEYAPEDQRTVHKNAGPQDTMSDWHERESTERERQHEQQERKGGQPGDQQQATKADSDTPRPEYDQYEVNQATSTNKQSQSQSQDNSSAQMGYGNARDEDEHMEQDVSSKGLGNSLDAPSVKGAKPGEISSNPAARAEADAERPLGKN